jgi:hypothetical protein
VTVLGIKRLIIWNRINNTNNTSIIRGVEMLVPIFITQMLFDNMALREIQPLEANDWNTLVSDLEKGQTKEQAKFLEESLKDSKNIPTTEY